MNLKNQCEKINLNFDEKFYENCNKFIQTLQEWGKIHNLSAELETQKIEKNIMDSIYPLSFLDSFESFADIGTGAGYPGLILAMAKPEVKAYLIEPRAKRVAFLNFIKNSLKLANVEIICNRIENVQEIKVDLFTSRAVTNTALLMELTKNLSSENTSFLFYKGSMLKSELENAKIKNYKIYPVNERNYLYIKGQK
ncbi:MAG: 16S rRNA (guanine(527)-N(7))-methyltransferase RsmG [Campylobacteraceae bacterium]|nr:16S rRNA (guanine(527)-N(7))-methyltransferase RsmG [Campylobacteraceae bacterium]